LSHVRTESPRLSQTLVFLLHIRVV
jgi:hypothetical protein